jgi:hypothetical protein
MLAMRMTTPTAVPASQRDEGLVRFMSGGTQPRAERFHPARPFFPPPGGAPGRQKPRTRAAGPGNQLVRWACPTRTRCPDDAGLPFACCRVTVIVGYWVGGTPDHNVTSPDWLNEPMGTRMPTAFFSHAW